MRALWVVALLAACTGKDEDVVEAGPLGIPIAEDGRIYAGAAALDMTPAIKELFIDANGDNSFGGCFDDPSGTGPDCNGEGFEDANGNGFFDARFIGGYGERRPALSIHEDDGISARAIVLAQDGSYVAMVALDLVGLGHLRINIAADDLADEGFDPDRLIVASTHNHQGPDTMGLWGDPLAGISGFDPDYQAQVAETIAQSVRDAAAHMVPVSLRVNAQHMRDRSPYFNGAVFGGKNPTPKMHGMVHDIRDPVIVSDQLLVVQGRDDADATIFTLTNWSGHPEVRGGNNNAISADWVGVTRKVVEGHFGGMALHFPESLGGMQSALGGDLPLVDPDGTHRYETCTAEAVADMADAGCAGKSAGDVRTDEDGLSVPLWAEHDSWAFVTSHGWHIGEAAIDLIESAEPVTTAPIRAEVEDGYVPVRNVAYNLLGPSGIFDFGLDDAMQDITQCPQASEVTLGCLPFRTWRVEVGPVGFVTAPGELLPELAWGLPTDDPLWVSEAADPAARGPSSRYFPQHDADCNTVGMEACIDEETVGDCNCLDIHAWPYTWSINPEHRPVLESLTTPYRAAMSMTSTYLSYIIPEQDVNHKVSLLSDNDGDHYEDTVTPAFDFGTLYMDAQKRIDARW